jgi:ABC-type transport system substrate-binding protein
MRLSRINPGIIIVSFFVLIFFGLCSNAEGQDQEPRGEIRVVESWRPDINVLGHNVLQYLYEFALDRNQLVPCLAVSREWLDDTTLELKLREGVRFHNGEPFDAYAVKFNFAYQRQHNPGRGIQVFMKNIREIKIVDLHTVRMIFDRPNALILDKFIFGPMGGWTIGAPRHMELVGWEEFLKRPVGTGPYKVSGVVKNYRKMGEGQNYAYCCINNTSKSVERQE